MSTRRSRLHPCRIDRRLFGFVVELTDNFQKHGDHNVGRVATIGELLDVE
ncbi:hypothetical protein KOR42_54650 [Thalassoglobus neptunius]|uniref:Uncharacterized protein n=1 Tax=Thalassoglobus neptunius TaxID=1938619 RepID=A0A5C5UVS7_9PLAN|nr:hypothetical protein KOR42_54650 [Thalassoglobus neptunius]